MPDLLSEITQAAKAYYAQASALPLTANDFYEWLVSLPVARHAEVTARGFAADQAEPDYLRYCLEFRGHSMWSFMAHQLTVPAFELWTTHNQFNGGLPAHGVGR